MVGLLLSGQGGSRDWCNRLVIGASEGLTKFPSSLIPCHRISEVKESVPSGKCVETQTNQQWASLLKHKPFLAHSLISVLPLFLTLKH